MKTLIARGLNLPPGIGNGGGSPANSTSRPLGGKTMPYTRKNSFPSIELAIRLDFIGGQTSVVNAGQPFRNRQAFRCEQPSFQVGDARLRDRARRDHRAVDENAGEPAVFVSKNPAAVGIADFARHFRASTLRSSPSRRGRPRRAKRGDSVRPCPELPRREILLPARAFGPNRDRRSKNLLASHRSSS